MNRLAAAEDVSINLEVGAARATKKQSNRNC